MVSGRVGALSRQVGEVDARVEDARGLSCLGTHAALIEIDVLYSRKRGEGDPFREVAERDRITHWGGILDHPRDVELVKHGGGFG